VLNSGEIIGHYHIHELKNDFIVVIMTNEFKEICFGKITRYITQKIEWELPAGGIENGEDIIEVDKREVIEETGYVLENVQHIFTFH
jgi:ADP-ribose pyrophosphatase